MVFSVLVAEMMDTALLRLKKCKRLMGETKEKKDCNVTFVSCASFFPLECTCHVIRMKRKKISRVKEI